MNGYSNEFRNILLAGLTYEPSERITLQNLLNQLNDRPIDPRSTIKVHQIILEEDDVIDEDEGIFSARNPEFVDPRSARSQKSNMNQKSPLKSSRSEKYKVK